MMIPDQIQEGYKYTAASPLKSPTPGQNEQELNIQSPEYLRISGNIRILSVASETDSSSAAIRILGIVLIAVSVAFGAQGCALKGKWPGAITPEITEAIAVIQPTAGNKVTGVVRFTQRRGKVRIQADIEGLAPNTKHGFHIHEFGDFSLPDATSAGGHYNPQGRKHGGPPDPDRHAGDLGNLEADAAGEVHCDMVVENISIGGAKNPIIGRGVVVHADTDDLKTQPTGNAGARIGFGIIGIAAPRK